MKTKQLVVAAGIICALILAATRYAFMKGDNGTVYRIDRWTGATQVVAFSESDRLAAMRAECHRFAEDKAAQLFKEQGYLTWLDATGRSSGDIDEWNKLYEQGTTYYIRDYEAAYRQCLRSKGLKE